MELTYRGTPTASPHASDDEQGVVSIENNNNILLIGNDVNAVDNGGFDLLFEVMFDTYDVVELPEISNEIQREH
jgi:hypothetical protein